MKYNLQYKAQAPVKQRRRYKMPHKIERLKAGCIDIEKFK